MGYNAIDLCAELAREYDARGDGRSQSLAATMRELGDVLGEEHSANALRSFWAFGLNAATDATQPIGVTLARKATLGEIISLVGGVPRDLDAEGAEQVGWALVEHYSAQDDGRSKAMAATFERERVAVRLTAAD